MTGELRGRGGGRGPEVFGVVDSEGNKGRFWGARLQKGKGGPITQVNRFHMVGSCG